VEVSAVMVNLVGMIKSISRGQLSENQDVRIIEFGWRA